MDGRCRPDDRNGFEVVIDDATVVTEHVCFLGIVIFHIIRQRYGARSELTARNAVTGPFAVGEGPDVRE
ncbi:hypothetical protein SAMN05216559_3840 [Halomicrobium zhouii]|uniref:Uncharacterized protein n=1 Tax=Halomicrobium zhouii TaxID=767519 RepID=A0A1I6M6J5_9EURY|nr:hypothetical protein [Halomicrobium zhouii]SFS11350.1 hypothetical protein SAMN05216559_3840 [Halomicrobium zhouii]